MGSYTAFILCISLPVLIGIQDNGSGYLIWNLQKYDISGEDGNTNKIEQFSIVNVNGAATPFFTHSKKVFKFDMEKMDGVLRPENLWNPDNDKAQSYQQLVQVNETTVLAFDSVSNNLIEILLSSGNSTDDVPQSKKSHRLNVSDANDIKLANTLSGKSTIVIAYGTVIAEQNLVTGHVTELIDVRIFYPTGEIFKLIMNNDGLLFVHLIQSWMSYIFYFNPESGILSSDPNLQSKLNASSLTQSFVVKFNGMISDFTLMGDRILLIADKDKYELKVLQVQTGSIYRICRLINGDSGLQIVPFASTEECAGTFEPRRVAFHNDEVYVIIRNQLATFSVTDAKYGHDEESLTNPILLRALVSVGVTASLLFVVSLASISYNVIVRLRMSRKTRTERQGKQSTDVEAANNRLEVIEMEAVVTASPSQSSPSTERDKSSASTPYPRRANLTRADVTLHDPAKPTASSHGPLTLTHRGSNNRHQKAPLVTYPSIKPVGNRPPAVPPKRLTDRHQVGTKIFVPQIDIRHDRNTADSHNSIATVHEIAEIVSLEDAKRIDHDNLYEEIPLERNNLR